MISPSQTERLLLKPLELADAAQIQVLFPHWEIVRYMLNVVPWPYPADGALTYVRDIALPAMQRGEQWFWTLRLRTAPGQIIGMINLRRGGDDNRGFWLGLPWQGQGYMTEACAWANDYWFDALEFSLLRVAKAAENEASRRVSQRQGMRLVHTTEKDFVSGRLPSEIWEITANEWHAWKTAHRT